MFPRQLFAKYHLARPLPMPHARAAVLMHLARRTFLPTAIALATTLGGPGAQAEPQAPFVMGTIQVDGTYAGKWLRKIYGEAFKRLGIPVEITAFPTQRLSVLADQGHVDGDVARVHGYAAAHPDLVRVEESTLGVVFALFTTQPALQLKRLEDLRESGLRGIYLRGVGICANTLKPFVPADRLLDITEEVQGLNMLLAGRSDFYCTSDLGIQSMLNLPEFKHVAPLRTLLAIGDVIPLYAYLHRKHAALVPRLAIVLRQMKAEGLVERYRLESLKEASGR